jgi:hypothetical protein
MEVVLTSSRAAALLFLAAFLPRDNASSLLCVMRAREPFVACPNYLYGTLLR